MREHGLVGDLEPGQGRNDLHRPHVQIGGGEDAPDGVIRNVDAADARMGQRAAHEGKVLHARQADVSNELATAA